jgi:phage-related protein
MVESNPKRLAFEGTSLKILKSWPGSVRGRIGHNLWLVQMGLEPWDWKPIKAIGQGVREIRVAEDGDQYRAIYVQIIAGEVHVLHCFVKKSQKTPQKDIEIAKARFREVKRRKDQGEYYE